MYIYIYIYMFFIFYYYIYIYTYTHIFICTYMQVGSLHADSPIMLLARLDSLMVPPYSYRNKFGLKFLMQ